MEDDYFDGYHSDDSVNRLVELGENGEAVSRHRRRTSRERERERDRRRSKSR